MNSALNAWHIHHATDLLSRGGVIAYPTEAVWGLGCDPFNEAAVHRILNMKRRSVSKGLIMVAASPTQIAALIDPLPVEQQQRLLASWPGPNTWLIPDPSQFIPSWIKGEHASVAVRVTDHPLVIALCQAWGGPLVSTSANPSHFEPARTKLRVKTYFRDSIDKLVDGSLGGRLTPSTIRSIEHDQIIRL